MTDKKINLGEIIDTDVPSSVIKPHFYNSINLPPKRSFVSTKPTKVQESPLDARSPQEVLDSYGMYKDPSYYEMNPDKIYLDLTQFDDYETHLNSLRDLKAKFSNLPIDVQAKFNHDPSKFCSYVMSSDFNIEHVMDENMLKNYKKYKTDEENRKRFEAYQQSDEYKQAQLDMINRAEFAEKQYQDWLKNKNLDTST